MLETSAQLTAGDRVLVTRLDYLGDVILSLPLVDAIHERYPGVSIDYLTRKPAADLLAGDNRFEKVFAQEPGVSQWLRLVRTLRERRYHAVIDLYSNPRSAWLCWLTRAAVRVGADRRGRRHLYTHPTRVPDHIRSATEFHVHYGRPLGIESEPGKPKVIVAAEDRSRAQAALRVAGLKAGGRVICIHPGGKWAVKRWPAGRFARLAIRIRDELDCAVVVLSGPGEEEHTREVSARAAGSVVTLPVLPIRTVAGVVEQMDAVVACDGGIMHLSAGVGTPTVGIFGSAEHEVWFPYRPFGPYRPAFVDVDCRPCHRHICPLGHTNCLNGLGEDAVLAEVVEVLSQRSVEGGQIVEGD